LRVNRKGKVARNLLKLSKLLNMLGGLWSLVYIVLVTL